jgi:hypothetical protein
MLVSCGSENYYAAYPEIRIRSGAGGKKSKVFVLVIVTSSQRVCQSISRRCVIQCPLATSLSLWA